MVVRCGGVGRTGSRAWWLPAVVCRCTTAAMLTRAAVAARGIGTIGWESLPGAVKVGEMATLELSRRMLVIVPTLLHYLAVTTRTMPLPDGATVTEL